MNNKHKLSKSQIESLLNRMGLLPISVRSVSLFGLSCIALSYTKLLKDLLGLTWTGIAALGDSKSFRTMLNEQRMAEDIENLLKKNLGKTVNIFIKPAKKIYIQTTREISKVRRYMNIKPIIVMDVITRIYPQYFSALAIYNALYRYLGNRTETQFISNKEVQKLGRERAEMARFYTNLETLIKLCLKTIGKKYKFDGQLLRMATLNEMNDFLRTRRILKKFIGTLRVRSKGYFYISTKKMEMVFTDKHILDFIEKKYYSFNLNIAKIKGVSAYPGMVQGRVVNLVDNRKGNVAKDCILVASMTHPKDTPLIKRSVAIVTDEGGILCHAAIVSREMKKPCVIGTKIATKVLKDGDRVEVDANKGIIRKLK